MPKEPINNFRFLLLTESLKASATEHSFLQSDFTDLDTKAQNTTAIAGIFLAGSLAFYSGDSLPRLVQLGGLPIVILLAIAVSMLVISVMLSIRTMTIREIEVVNSADATKEVNDLLRAELVDEEWPVAHERYVRGQIEHWESVNSDLAATNDDKAQSLFKAQLCLSLAVILVGFLLLFILFGAWIFRTQK